MLGVLMYLFKNHMQSDCKLYGGSKKLTNELKQIGFKKEAINKALNWLAELSTLQYSVTYNPPHKKATRIYSPDESKKIGRKGLNLITSLERMGILNSATRELVISQVMQLDHPRITVNQIKWVALMVLFNQKNQYHALLCLEYLVLNENRENTIH
jgi:Smg protein